MEAPVLAQLLANQPPLFPRVVLVLCLVGLFVVSLIGWWKLATKAGLPGWSMLIPPYFPLALRELTGLSWWAIVLLQFPLANIAVWAATATAIASAFGHGLLYAVGLFLLIPIFGPILGLGSRMYRGPACSPSLGAYADAPLPELDSQSRACINCGHMPPESYPSANCPSCPARTFRCGPTFVGVLSSRTALGTTGFAALLAALTLSFAFSMLSDPLANLWPSINDPSVQWGVWLGGVLITALVILAAPWRSGGCSRVYAIPGGMLVTTLTPRAAGRSRHVFLPIDPNCTVALRSVSDNWARLDISNPDGSRAFAAGIACLPSQLAPLADAIRHAISRPPSLD